MENVENTSLALVGMGLATYGGALLFMGGPLTLIGWIVAVSFFAGGIGLFANPAYKAGKAIFGKGKELVEKVINNDEKNQVKPGTEATA